MCDAPISTRSCASGRNDSRRNPAHLVRAELADARSINEERVHAAGEQEADTEPDDAEQHE
jgi:hypothetical protein